MTNQLLQRMRDLIKILCQIMSSKINRVHKLLHSIETPRLDTPSLLPVDFQVAEYSASGLPETQGEHLLKSATIRPLESSLPA